MGAFPFATTNRPGVGWVYAWPNAAEHRPKGSSTPGMEGAGKWLIFSRRDDHPAAWEVISTATEQGRLGPAAKAATVPGKGDGFVICVYTKDAEDLEDIGRVLRVLRELGFRQPLSYKSDANTLALKYGRGASTYRSSRFE